MQKEKLIIIGSGPAGLTAAIYTARANLSPLVFEGMEPGGQLMGTSEIENFPGFPDGIVGPTLINNMRTQAQKFGAKTIFKEIDRVDFTNTQNLKVWSGEEEFQAESIILATGVSARWLNLNKGEEKFLGKGYSACATCDGAFFREKVVGVVGGGDSACEEAIILSKFAKKVYILHRRDSLRASLPMQKKVFEDEKIEILWNKDVTNLKGSVLLEEVELTDTQTNEISSLNLNGLFMAIGHTPNTKFLEGQIDLNKWGFIEIKNDTRTNVPSVFVGGDVSDPKYQQAIVAAGSGCQAALDVQEYLRKH